MSEWQLIESAPTDGTKFLGAWPSQLIDDEEWYMQPMKFKDGCWVVTWDFDDSCTPTHWMPLPSHPVSDE